MICDCVKPGRSLVAEQYGSGSRLVGKQFAMAQKFCIAVNFRNADSGKQIVMQLGRLGQMVYKARYQR